MKIYGITGISGSGKTTICKKVIELNNKNNLRIEGFISPAIFHLDKKVGINVVNISTGEERTLAEINDDPHKSNLFGKWRFNFDTIGWIKNYINQVGNCDIFIADEIGPLEIELGKGWAEISEQINRNFAKIAIFTFRPKFINYFIERYPDIEIIDVSKPSGEGDLERSLKSLLS